MAFRDFLRALRGERDMPTATALQRAKVQRQMQYLGAALGRLTRITAPNLSADRSMDADVRTLVKNSRDAARNNGYAKRFIRMAKNNIAGPRGVAMRPVNTLRSDPDRPNDRLNDAVTQAWRLWSQPRYASTNGRLSWLALQRLAVNEWITAGEAVLQIVYDAANPFGMSLHPIDADRLDRDFNRPAGSGVNEVRFGVEIDAVGRPVAYHVLSRHPSEVGLRAGATYRERVPAEQIIHLYTQDERVDLTRGVPHLAVALRDLGHIGDAQDASLIALKVNASVNGFITTTGDGVEADDPPDEEAVYIDGEPGQFKYLGKGQQIQVPDVNQPQDNYPDFVRAVLRSVAVGLGTSYAMLAGDWSDANFSSLRTGRADETDEWMALQEHFITVVCQRVFEAWLTSAVLNGALTVPGYDVTLANAVAWQGRRWVSPKPLEDVEVAEREIALGVNSRSRYVAQRGDSLWDVWDELAEEREYAAEKRITVEPPRKGVTATSTPLPERPAESPDDSAQPPAATNGKGRLRLTRALTGT